MSKIIDLFTFKKKKAVDKIKSEQPLIGDRLRASLDSFYMRPTGDSLYAIFDELVYAVIYGIAFQIPLDTRLNQVEYALYNLQGIGWTYVACTDAEELLKAPSTASTAVMVRQFLERVANDDEIAGLVLNPYHESAQGAVVYLNRENVRNILRIAYDSISEQPDHMKDVLLGKNHSN